MVNDNLAHYLQRAPKAELHVHLEGAILPETFLQLAQQHGLSLPITTAEEAKQWFRYRDFPHFIEIFVTISNCMRTEEDYELVAYEFGREMARQNVRYAEVTFSPSTHRFIQGVPHDTYFSGLQKGRARAKVDFGVEIRWVFDIVRNTMDGERELHRRADYTTAVAIECMQEGVVALGLGGLEPGHPPEPFAPWFEKALSAGLHSAPHAGELDGPASVWGAIRTLGAERIGHGTRSIEDATLVTHLAQQQIALELCPYSNLCLGVYPDIAIHPLPHLYAAGVPVTVNSDDPPLFNTTLNHNVAALSDVFQLDLATIDDILLNGVRYSFLPDEQKQAMEQAFIAEMAQLKSELQLTSYV